MLTIHDLALSTMWNYPFAKSGAEIIESITDMGFVKIELNYQVREEFLAEIHRMIDKNAVQVVSLHNVFPKIDDQRFGTDSMLLGYPDEELRKMAVCHSQRTIDWAARFCAKAVVFHPSEVPLDPGEFDRPLKLLIQERKRNTPEFRELFVRMIKKRQAGIYLNALKRSLDELSSYIARKGYDVFLGMENRSMCHQIPIFSEFEAIMDGFSDSSVRLWLDTGHGIMMEEIGLQSLLPPMELAKYIIGMHIHDAGNGRDHFPPGMLEGAVLEPYFPFIISSPIKVLEISSRFSAEAIQSSAQWLLDQLEHHSNIGS